MPFERRSRKVGAVADIVVRIRFFAALDEAPLIIGITDFRIARSLFGLDAPVGIVFVSLRAYIGSPDDFFAEQAVCSVIRVGGRGGRRSGVFMRDPPSRIVTVGKFAAIIAFKCYLYFIFQTRARLIFVFYSNIIASHCP